jgi:hypothetical protein
MNMRNETTYGPPTCPACGKPTPLPGTHKCKPSYQELKASLAEKDKRIEKLKTEVTGCIQYLDEGEFPNQPKSELERKLSEAIYNHDEAVKAIQAQLLTQQEAYALQGALLIEVEGRLAELEWAGGAIAIKDGDWIKLDLNGAYFRLFDDISCFDLFASKVVVSNGIFNSSLPKQDVEKPKLRPGTNLPECKWQEAVHDKGSVVYCGKREDDGYDKIARTPCSKRCKNPERPSHE